MNLLDLFVKIGVDDQASDKVAGIGAKITKGLGNAVKTVGKVVAGATAAAGTGALALTKAAVDSYASYEQLVGGVDKLYQGASDKLQKYAQDAYKTSGMSANDYMEQATSFSAALINSLGGDVDKAADQTDKAMRLMSDNVNTFGTDSEAVQNAIQGLSRENYTMLDNLKLGYAGTKDGMEELIKDAEDYAKKVKGMDFESYAKSMENTGMSTEELRKRYDELTNSTDLTMGNFSDMVDAIDIIQEKQNIWGTTSREAMSTIEGSMNAAKASWDNLITGIGAGDQDIINSAVSGLVTSIFGTWSDETQKREGGLINNMLPVLQRTGEAIMKQIPQIARLAANLLIESFATNVLGMDNVGAQEFVDDINYKFDDLLAKVTDIVAKVGDALSSFWESFSGTADMGYANVALDKFLSIAEQVWTFIEDNVLANADAIGEFLGNVVNFLGSVATTALTVIDNLGPFVPMIAGAIAGLGALSAVTSIIGAITGAVTFFTTVLMPALAMIQSVPGLIAVVTTALGGPITIIAAIVGAIVAFLATNEEARAAILEVWEGIKAKFFEVKDAVGEKLREIGEFFGNLKDTADQKLGEVVGFFENLPQNILDALGDLGNLLVNAGESIISGLWDGLTSKFSEVQDWVGGIGTWIAEHKGPKQYDLGLLVDNGMWIMDSLQRGLEKGLPSVEDTLSGITDTIQTGINASADVSVARGGNDDAILGMLASILNAIPNAVYLDGRALVGQLAPDMNAAMGVL